MTASDHLGPQWDALRDFDPESASYAGSQYQFQRVPGGGEMPKRTSRNVANMQAQHYAADVRLGVSTGATTNRRAQGGKMVGFTPNTYDEIHAGPGAWN